VVWALIVIDSVGSPKVVARGDERPQTNPPQLTNNGHDHPKNEIKRPQMKTMAQTATNTLNMKPAAMSPTVMWTKRQTMTNVIVRRCAFHDATVSTHVRPYPSLIPLVHSSYMATPNDDAPPTNGDTGPRPPPKNNYEPPAARTAMRAWAYQTRPAAPPPTDGDERPHHHLMNGNVPCTTPPTAMTTPHPHLQTEMTTPPMARCTHHYGPSLPFPLTRIDLTRRVE
jgi:hypothetical protein